MPLEPPTILRPRFKRVEYYVGVDSIWRWECASWGIRFISKSPYVAYCLWEEKVKADYPHAFAEGLIKIIPARIPQKKPLDIWRLNSHNPSSPSLCKPGAEKGVPVKPGKTLKPLP